MAKDLRKSLWFYDGEVMSFDRLVGTYKGKTWAVSEKKAAQNIIFSYKMQQGLEPHANIKLAEKPVLLYKAS